MDEQRTEPRPGSCIICPVTRPDAEPRLPNHPPVCDGDRLLLDRWLVEIANLDADLRNDEAPILDGRTHERFGTAYLPNGRRHVWSKGSYASDPVGALGGVAPINSKSSQPNVGGSRERPMPINAAAHDLKAPARVPNPTAQARRHPADQVGTLSTATVLDQWVRDWRDLLWPGHHLPEATVDQLVLWLRTRLEDACDSHPAVDEFAAEIKARAGMLRSAAGVVEPQPERCDGVACKQCDYMTLVRKPGGGVDCLNENCRAVLTDDEYRDWVKTLGKEQKIKRHADANS